MENRHIIINGRLISYTEAGRGTKTLLFLHGWRSNKEAWLPIIGRMTDLGYRLIFVDLPGFGGSEIPHNAYTLNDYAETISIFAEKLDLTIHCVIGHSFGARIALKLAAAQPTLAEKIVLVASGGAQPSFTSLKKIVAAIVRPFFMFRAAAPLRKKIYKLIGAEDYIATPELKATFINIVNENLDTIFPKITTETLIIWGDKDTTAPVSYGQHMATHIQHSQLIIIPHAGHYCFSDNPEFFTNAIINFLKK